MSLDREQRNRAVEETSRSFIVEASAGTGKTTVLTRRMLHCVLESGSSGAPVPLSRLCAITFTEKAAGEMKIRLRQEFERRAAAPDPLGRRARQALLDLESASISTFHAFAVALLKERPVEAGLDPRFTALDEIQGEILFREVWDFWLKRVLDERSPALEQALRAGLGLDALRSAASALRRHAHAIRNLALPAPPTDEELQQRRSEMRRVGLAFLARCLDPSDKLATPFEDALAWLADPQGKGVPQKGGAKGAAGKWEGGKPTVESAREFLSAAVDFRTQMRLLPAQRALDAIVRLIVNDFLPEWERQKRARGYLDFDDQLWCACELLSSSSSARAEFQNRYAALLVDEFQDTDPVQWKIIRLLAAPSGDSDAVPGMIAGGRLFIVGDPKQSIYRFRGADIETYSEVTSAKAREDLDLALLELTSNFRSVPAILDFVDEAFRAAMAAGPDKSYQPRYLAFDGRGARDGGPGGVAVHLLGDRNEEGDPAGGGPDFSERESERIARLIASIPGNADWQVQTGSTWRNPRLRDVAILLPVLTHADDLEDALRAVGIPYVLEGGKFYYARSEVCSAIMVLRAISNPNDRVALYGALRSIFFGLSDEDLLRAKMDGQPFDYREEVPAGCSLHHPFQILRALHRHRHERTASETLEHLLRDTGGRETLAPRGIQSLANLNKLVRTMRSLQQNSTFSEVVELIRSMDEEGMAESESRIMEEHSDAVRILSIHRAKGLDFPIVIVAGLGIQRQSRRPEFLSDPHGLGTYGLHLGSKEAGMQTPGWNDLVERDKEREDAELTRLLYVALTRARDHLILSTHGRGKKLRDTGPWAHAFDKTRLKPLAEFLPRLGREGYPGVRWLDPDSLPGKMAQPASDGAPADGAWSERLAAEYEELDRLLSSTPAARRLLAVTASEEMPGEVAAIDTPRDRAVRLGIAFHRAMNALDFAKSPDAEALAREAGSRQQLDEESCRMLMEMIHTSLGSDLITRARQALSDGRRIFKELPFVRALSRDAEEIQEGNIDLLFEETDGWVLVDYKTDHVAEGWNSESPLAQKYEGQIKAYAAAMKSLGIEVRSAWLLLARTGAQVEIPV
jgi:ATP-dependent helicase/nuclease subunit A